MGVFHFWGVWGGHIVFGVNGVKFTLKMTKEVTENVGFKQDTIFVLIITNSLIRMLNETVLLSTQNICPN